jgi:hypothetical protein
VIGIDKPICVLVIFEALVDILIDKSVVEIEDVRAVFDLTVVWLDPDDIEAWVVLIDWTLWDVWAEVGIRLVDCWVDRTVWDVWLDPDDIKDWVVWDVWIGIDWTVWNVLSEVETRLVDCWENDVWSVSDLKVVGIWEIDVEMLN